MFDFDQKEFDDSKLREKKKKTRNHISFILFLSSIYQTFTYEQPNANFSFPRFDLIIIVVFLESQKGENIKYHNNN